MSTKVLSPPPTPGFGVLLPGFGPVFPGSGAVITGFGALGLYFLGYTSFSRLLEKWTSLLHAKFNLKYSKKESMIYSLEYSKLLI